MVVIGGTMIGMRPHVAEIAECSHSEEEDGCRRTDEHY